jgi:glutathione S-transferase
MVRVFGMAESGNCYKVKLLLSQLGQPFEWVETDIMQGASRKDEFLRMNPNGKVPTLEISPGVYLPESNAILCYLAEGSQYWSGDRLTRARVMQWMFFEQYSHEPYVAVARFILLLLKQPDHPQLADKQKRSHDALKVMDAHLLQQPFFAGSAYSIADIALYAYTHVADEGGLSLAGYPAIRAWMDRVKSQPGHVPMRD